jgi:hypothetical protein
LERDVIILKKEKKRKSFTLIAYSVMLEQVVKQRSEIDGGGSINCRQFSIEQ